MDISTLLNIGMPDCINDALWFLGCCRIIKINGRYCTIKKRKLFAKIAHALTTVKIIELILVIFACLGLKTKILSDTLRTSNFIQFIYL